MSNDSVREQALERALPNSAEAERAILGGILLDNGLISQSVELLKLEDWYVPSHRRIFAAMIALFEHGAEINPILIGEELKKENALESVGGISFITNLTYGLPYSTNVEHYARIVKDKSMLRKLIKECNKAVQEALEQEDEADAILDHAQTAIFKLGEEKLRGRLEPVKPIAEAILEKIQAMEGRKSVVTGIATGYDDLDKMTSGFQRQDLVLIAARPSMGKTSFALNIAENVATHSSLFEEMNEQVVAIFSLEMSKEALVMRMLCSQSNVDHQRFRNGFLSRPEWAQIAKALGVLADAKIFLDDTAGISTLEMRAKCMRLAAEQKRLDLIVVDYLQLMSGSTKRFESRNQEISQISRELKALAKEFNCPVVALSQLSRAPELRSNHRPQISDLRESGSLEQDADVVAFIYREEQYKTPQEREHLPEDQKNVGELIVAKQRNGPTGTVDLRFTPSSMRFDNLYRE